MVRPASAALAAALVAVGALGIAALPGRALAGPHRDPDVHDHGEFWGEVVSPHRDQVQAIKRELRDALAIIAADWSPDHRLRVLAEATRIARHARSLDPGDVEVVYFLGALADEGGKTSDAVRFLTEASQRAPRGPARIDALVRLGKL
ncbi:MAG: hypothetical protein K8M05_27950, partial [Deltaproteobacteria bacterium]|nr:hypothetical protein [Kofleriaceae bacterium]